MKNKNKLFQYFSFTVYPYAPESFKLFFQGKEIKLSHSIRHKMGYTLITEGKTALMKVIKKWVRNDSTMNMVTYNPILAILSEDKKESYHIRQHVNRYDINQKLNVFKWLKESIENKQFALKTTSYKLDGNYNPFDVQEVEQEIRLGNRVVFI